MVQVTSYFVASLALLSGFVEALPRPDSSMSAAAMPQSTDMSSDDSSSWDSSSGSNYGSGSSYGSGSNYGSSNSYSGSSDSSSGYGSSSGSSSSSYGSGSSYGSSGSNYGSSSGNYGSSNSNYGSSSGNYGSGNSYGGSSSDTWSTSTALATSTSSAYSSYSTPSYGSGSSSWGGSSGYSDCVSQCMANYGSPAASYTPPPSSTSNGYDSSSGSSGSGATHTVIVAPTQGVLRFVPFATNASVGDTIMFMWGANNHTVTKSSELTPCNKTSDNLFTSGEQNQGFTFTQVVNDTNPIFYYCGTPTHCQKGMFGIINPPNADTPTSVSNMMASIAANSSDVAGYASYTAKQTTGNTAAATWGSNIDLASLPEWSHEFVAENVLYTRNLLAANPDIITSDGSVNLGAAGSNPLMIPMDLAAALASAAPASSTPAAPAASSPASSPAAAAASAPSGTSTAAAKNSGAFTISSSKVVVGLVAAFATFLMM